MYLNYIPPRSAGLRLAPVPQGATDASRAKSVPLAGQHPCSRAAQPRLERRIINTHMLIALLAVQTKSVRFLPPTPLIIATGPLSVPGGHAAPAIFDIDADGLEDLFVGQFNKGTINLFKHEGTAERHVYNAPTTLIAADKPAQVDYGCCIGATPQLVDLDNDNRTDIVSGSYTKGLWFFRGLGEGKFAEGAPLTDENNSPLNPGPALAPAFADWDGDKDLDMVLGTQQGAVLLLKNDGAMRFGQQTKLTWDTNEIQALHGGPALFDFDKDGVTDLLLGDLHGNLILYFGKEKGGTDFTAGKSVFPAFPKEPRPGIRLKPTVFDWNHDGKPDILVGDYRPDQSPVTPLPQNVEDEIARLTASSSNYAFQIFTRSQGLEDVAKRETGVTNLATATPEQRARFDAALARLTANDKPLNDLKANKAGTDQRIELLCTQKPIEGTVWILYGI